jgi:hypothetical protein
MPMSTKPKYFLLDAGPIIELHRLDLWNAVLDRTDIFVPRVVAETEAEFWVREDNSRRPINAIADGEAGRLIILDCDQADLRETFHLFDHAVQQSVDPGELHALTLLRLWENEPMPAFCSADKMAIVCLCLLGFSDAATSLEGLLSTVGLSANIRRQFSQEVMDLWIPEGRRRHIQGQGLA